MIMRYHEAPIDIFDAVQAETDGDYALVHLFEDEKIGEQYYKKFKRAVEDGRDVILDNSIFELGVAFDEDKYVGWIKELKPTYFVIPDVLEDGDATWQRAYAFVNKYPELASISKSIGVVQGKDYEDMKNCYEKLHDWVDVIAFSFDLSTYADYVRKVIAYPLSDLEATCMGRATLLAKMVDEGVIDLEKPHHLLGVALPQEMLAYRNCSWIRSVDTSNPIVHGMCGLTYTDRGLPTKIKTKMCDLMGAKITPTEWWNIQHNISMFEEFCNG